MKLVYEKESAVLVHNAGFPYITRQEFTRWYGLKIGKVFIGFYVIGKERHHCVAESASLFNFGAL